MFSTFFCFDQGQIFGFYQWYQSRIQHCKASSWATARGLWDNEEKDALFSGEWINGLYVDTHIYIYIFILHYIYLFMYYTLYI